MIKGINKQVLEISETNNGCFEKALFFVKPEYSHFSENKLRDLAHSELKNATHPPKQKKFSYNKKIKVGLFGLAIFLVGLVVGFLISFIIWYLLYNMLKYL